METKTKIIQITHNEALVLYDFLWRFGDTGKLEIVDQAEERALWNLKSCLEKQISEMFSPNYISILAKARDELRDEEFDEEQ